MSLSRHGSLGLLLAAPPGHPATLHALQTAHQALASQDAVHIYCLHDGVLCVDDPELQSLRQQGALVAACAYAAERHQIPLSNHAVFGGILLLAQIIARTDLFLAFSPSTPGHTQHQPDSTAFPVTADRRPVLVHMHASPLIDPLAAEGCRVGAGLAIHPGLHVTLLWGQSSHMAEPHPTPKSPNPELLRQHIVMLTDSGGRLLLSPGSTRSDAAFPSLHHFPDSTPDQLDAIVRESFAVLDF